MNTNVIMNKNIIIIYISGKKEKYKMINCES